MSVVEGEADEISTKTDIGQRCRLLGGVSERSSSMVLTSESRQEETFYRLGNAVTEVVAQKSGSRPRG